MMENEQKNENPSLTGGDWRSFLQDKKNKDLLEFTKGFMELLKNANLDENYKIGRVVSKEIGTDKKVLDTFAKLLARDEICVAVAISGNEFLLATNEGEHNNDYIKYKKTFKVLENRSYPQRFVVEFVDTLICVPFGQKARKIRKSSGPVIYQFVASEQYFKVIEGNPDIIFTQDEHKIPFPRIPDAPVCIKGSLTKNKEDLDILIGKAPLNKEKTVIGETPIEAYLLRQTATKLIENLAMIAHSIITKPALRNRVADLMEQNKHWPLFLNLSLSYLLSKRADYQEHLNPYAKDDPGLKAMYEFYKWLVGDYQEFKKKKGLKTSVSSIEDWFSSVGRNINLSSVPAPDWIKDSPDDFIKLTKKHLKRLVKIEKFVKKDAENNGRLANILTRFHMFKRSALIQFIGGISELHAEMRLFEHRLKNEKENDDYFGINKLCCAHCIFAMKQFELAGSRGSSARIFSNWKLSDEIKNNEEYFKTFLGADLYNKYREFSNKTCWLPNVKRVKGNESKKADIALMIISTVAALYTEKTFNVLKIDKGCFFPTETTEEDMYYSSTDDEYDSGDEKSGHISIIITEDDQVIKRLVLRHNINTLSQQLGELAAFIGKPHIIERSKMQYEISLVWLRQVKAVGPGWNNIVALVGEGLNDLDLD